MKAKKFEQQFDSGVDITAALDMNKAKRVGNWGHRRKLGKIEVKLQLTAPTSSKRETIE